MKFLTTTILALFITSLVSAQAFRGKGDKKLNIGVSLQDNATGMAGTYDLGVANIVSVGVSAGYLLGVDELLDPGFTDRFDVKARGNVHFGPAMNLGDDFDIYSGLSLSLKNFGFQGGARYSFTEDIGVFVELAHPIASYSGSDKSLADKLNDQLVFNLGITLNFL